MNDKFIRNKVFLYKYRLFCVMSITFILFSIKSLFFSFNFEKSLYGVLYLQEKNMNYKEIPNLLKTHRFFKLLKESNLKMFICMV